MTVDHVRALAEAAVENDLLGNPYGLGDEATINLLLVILADKPGTETAFGIAEETLIYEKPALVDILNDLGLAYHFRMDYYQTRSESVTPGNGNTTAPVRTPFRRIEMAIAEPDTLQNFIKNGHWYASSHSPDGEAVATFLGVPDDQYNPDWSYQTTRPVIEDLLNAGDITRDQVDTLFTFTNYIPRPDPHHIHAAIEHAETRHTLLRDYADTHDIDELHTLLDNALATTHDLGM